MNGNEVTIWLRKRKWLIIFCRRERVIKSWTEYLSNDMWSVSPFMFTNNILYICWSYFLVSTCQKGQEEWKKKCKPSRKTSLPLLQHIPLLHMLSVSQCIWRLNSLLQNFKTKISSQVPGSLLNFHFLQPHKGEKFVGSCVINTVDYCKLRCTLDKKCSKWTDAFVFSLKGTFCSWHTVFGRKQDACFLTPCLGWINCPPCSHEGTECWITGLYKTQC